MVTLLFFGLGLMLSLVLLAPLREMASNSGFTRRNYRGDMIPVGVGLVFFFAPAAAFALSFIFVDPVQFQRYLMAFLFTTGTMALLGLLDDAFGSRNASGIKGHLRCLIRGELTTGALKALGGLVIAFLAAATTGSLREVVLNTLIIALSANTLNLLDLRPGRAGKGFLLGAALLAWYAWGSNLLVFPAVVAGALVAYLPVDLRARSMMGDTGSNVLGVTLGLTVVWVLDLPVRVVVLLGLIVFHLFTERYSLTEVIERNRVLRFVDRLGRPREEFDNK